MADITVAQLTSGTVAGNGVFDELMRATKAHLAEEFQAGRITGSDYANVYLSSLNAVMQQAVQFLLNEQQADKQAELLEAQKLQTQAQTALINQQTANALTENTNLLKQQAKLDAETALLLAQELKVDQETLLVTEQKDLVVLQQVKTTSETNLLNQKKFTEEAQILDTVNGNTVVGLMGKQKTLYERQADGFLRDAEQKAADILIKTWNIRRSTDETGTLADATNKLSDTDIGQVVTKLKAGIGT